MQQWLSDKFANTESLADMIVNYQEFKAIDPFNLSIAGQKIKDSFLYCLESFENNEVIIENKDISFNPKDKLCPDFLVYAPETQSVIIIELKNISGPTRQAGTEIGAYAAEIKTYLPFISDGDIINVLISNKWPTLLRHSAFIMRYFGFRKN